MKATKLFVPTLGVLLIALGCESKPKTTTAPEGVAALGASADCPRGCSCITAPTVVAKGDLDETTRLALVEALNDERHAEAMYEAAMVKYGTVRPFSNIVNAERCHQRQLTAIFNRYGLELPADPWEKAIFDLPTTLGDACRAAAQAEVDNIALYDKLLPTIEQADIKATFQRLRDVSERNHLPAFKRRAARAS